jgi:hypothetical protein
MEKSRKKTKYSYYLNNNHNNNKINVNSVYPQSLQYHCGKLAPLWNGGGERKQEEQQLLVPRSHFRSGDKQFLPDI